MRVRTIRYLSDTLLQFCNLTVEVSVRCERRLVEQVNLVHLLDERVARLNVRR